MMISLKSLMKPTAKNPVEVTIQYPSYMRPGEDRFINKGLKIGAFNGKIKLEIRCNDIIITSNNPHQSNNIEINGLDEEQLLSLHYHAQRDLNTPLKKEFGIFISKKCIDKLKLSILSSLVVLFTLPSLTLAFKFTFLKVNLSLGDIAIVNLPLFLIISFIFTAHRFSLILKKIIEYEVSVFYHQSSHGMLDIINITNNPPSDVIDMLSFKCTI